MSLNTRASTWCEPGGAVGGRRTLVEAPGGRAGAPARPTRRTRRARASARARAPRARGTTRVDLPDGAGWHAADSRNRRRVRRGRAGWPRERDCRPGRRGAAARGGGAVELRQQRVARGDRRVAEPAHGARSGVGNCAAVVEHDDVADDAAHRVDEPADRVQRRRARPVSTTALGSSARSARPSRVSSIAGVSDSVRRPARRRTTSSAWAWRASRSHGRRGVEDQHAVGPGRREGTAADRRQPAGRVAPGELVLGASDLARRRAR